MDQFVTRVLECKWRGCTFNTTDGEQLFVHVCNDHIGRKATNNLCLDCYWGDCTIKTSKRDHITSHIRRHIPFTPYKCPHCDKFFKRPQDLKKHDKVHQTDQDGTTTTTTTDASITGATLASSPLAPNVHTLPQSPASMGSLTPSTMTSNLSPSPGPYTTTMMTTTASMDYPHSMFPQLGVASPCSSTSELQYASSPLEPMYQPLELNDDDLPIGMLASTNLAATVATTAPTINPMMYTSSLNTGNVAAFDMPQIVNNNNNNNNGNSNSGTGKRSIDPIEHFVDSIKKQRMEPDYNLAMMALLNEMAPMISELNELPQTIKTEHDQMLLEQFCLSLTDNIDQEQGQEVNQYVNLDMCSDEALQNRSQLAMGNTPTTESAFRIDQATMEKLSLTSTTPSELYPSPTIPMNSQSTDPALISYRTPSKSPMPVPTINGYAVSPGSINESYVPDWSSSTSLPGQSLFPDLGNSQAQASSPASVYNNLLVTAASQTTTPMYNAPVNMTTNTYLTSSSNMVQPTNMGRIEINANPQGVNSSISREQRVEPNVRTVPIIMPGQALMTQAAPTMVRMPIYPQPNITGYHPMQVQRHMLLPQREAAYHQASSTASNDVRREHYQVPYQAGHATSMPQPTRKSSLQSMSTVAGVASVVSTSVSVAMPRANTGQRSASVQSTSMNSHEKTSKYYSSVSNNKGSSSRCGSSSSNLPGKPEAEPCNIRMNYIDEGGFVDVNVDHIADQLSGLSVADNGVQPSAPRPASSSASAVTHHSVSMPEPQIYRGNEASSYGARASSTAAAATSVRKTVVDYKTREEHKALIETLLKRISVLFQKQEEKTNSSRARRQDDTSSHWQLLDSHGGSSTSQEVN